MILHRRFDLGDLGLAPDEAGDLRAQVPRRYIQCPQRRKLRLQPWRADLKQPDRGGQVPQPPRPQIQKVNSTEQARRRLSQQDLAAVPGGHHPRGPVEHGTEVVGPPQLGFAGRDPHPHRQLQRPLSGHCGIHRTLRRSERDAHAVAGVLEHPTAVCLDGPA
jgi:hypothetical protein